MSNPTLGKLLNGGEQRDAIHVAIVPVTAGEPVKPGQHVGLIKSDGKTIGRADDPIGIVDPFLRSTVQEGQSCYLCLYQNTVTGMRHVWEHPSFKDEAPLVVETTSEELSIARDYVCELAEEVGSNYQELMDGAAKYLNCGSYLYGGYQMEGTSVPDEFWDHYEVLTGTKVPSDSRGSFFSCSC
jgi:hypothetical protein